MNCVVVENCVVLFQSVEKQPPESEDFSVATDSSGEDEV